MSRREDDRQPAPDPPRRDDAGNPLPPDAPRPGAPPEAETRGGEGGGGDAPSPGGGGGPEVM